jgi:hypothetical protein
MKVDRPMMHSDVARRAKLGDTQLGETPRPFRSTTKVDRSMMHSDAARRAQLGEAPRPRRSTMKVDRSISSPDRSISNPDRSISNPDRSISNPDRSVAHAAHRYFTFIARAGGAEIAFVVANGRAFAGVRSWTR